MARYPKDMLEQMLSALSPKTESSGPPAESSGSSAPGRPRAKAKPKAKPPVGGRRRSRGSGSSAPGLPGSGGPFALGGSKATPRPSRPAGQGGRGDMIRESLAHAGLPRLAIILALLLVAAFFLGRASRPIRAQEPAVTEQSSDPAPSREARAPATGAEEQPAADRPDPEAALKDPSNRFSVLVVTYQDTPEQRDLARATHAHLRGSGLPVFRPYRYHGKLLLLVGAAPRERDLSELRDRLRDLESARGRREFGDAYVVPIEDFIQR